MNYLNSGKKELCSGCAACVQACPQQCIAMAADEKGFLYPIIDKEKCINCGLCIKICPMDKDMSAGNYTQPACYAGVHKNNEVLQKSSSGGAFTAITESFCDKDTVVFGAVLTGDIKVEHKGILFSEDAISSFRKSKYVQSEIKNAYREAKQTLDSGAKVLFSGTPCQIAGLRAYLRKPYENLMCVDLICHGVGSQAVLEKHLKTLERKHQSKVSHYDMRGKIEENEETYNCIINFENGKVLHDRSTDLFTRFYKTMAGYRESCYACPFAKIPRVADITIGDCWGIQKIKPGEFKEEGVSSIIINNAKGEKYFDEVSSRMRILDIPLQEMEKHNHNIAKTTEKSKKDRQFWRIQKILPIDAAMQRILRGSFGKRVVKRVMREIKKLGR